MRVASVGALLRRRQRRCVSDARGRCCTKERFSENVGDGHGRENAWGVRGLWHMGENVAHTLWPYTVAKELWPYTVAKELWPYPVAKELWPKHCGQNTVAKQLWPWAKNVARHG